jgi:hypothetical protein
MGDSRRARSAVFVACGLHRAAADGATTSDLIRDGLRL